MTREMFPPVTLERVDDAVANARLVEWEHPLDECHRPFRQECHGLFVHGDLIGVTVTASTVSATVDGLPRRSVVELARIARHPDARWVLRPLLRLWRESVAPCWPCWTVEHAVSYAVPGTPGNLYRWDGWRCAGEVKPSGGGGTWSSTPKVNAIADGVKTLWIYDYPGVTA